MKIPLSSLQGMIGNLLRSCPGGCLSCFEFPDQDGMDHADFSLPLSLACEKGLAEARSALRQWTLTGKLPPCPEIAACVLRLSLQAAGETYGTAASMDKSFLPPFPWPEEDTEEFLGLVFDDFSAASVEHCIDQHATEAEERWRNRRDGGGGNRPPEVRQTKPRREMIMPAREDAPAPWQRASAPSLERRRR